MTLSLLGGQPAFPQAIPFSRPTLPPMSEVQQAIATMLGSGMVTKGSQLDAYEAALTAYTGAPHCLGVSSCTAGLMLVLQGLAARGAIAVPSYSFIASFTAPSWNGLSLRFVDCEPETWTISLASLRHALEQGGVGVVLATYIFGNPPDIDGLEALCREFNVPLVFDAAHAFGSLYLGQRPGGRGAAEVFSTSATKLLATGEGGVVATTRPELARHVHVGREYGNPGNYDCLFPGLNARLSEFHSILGQWSLSHLEETAARRNELARRLIGGLQDVPGIRFQKIRDGCRSSYKDFAITVGPEFGMSRDQLATVLRAEGISSRAYFDPPGHRQTAFRQAVELPATEAVCATVLCLPMHTLLSDTDADRMASVIREVHARAGALQDALKRLQPAGV